MSNQLPEATSSVTYSLITSTGFPILFTLRAESGTKLLDQMKILEKKLVTDGFKAQEKNKGSYPKKEPNYIDGKPCPQCDSRLVLSTTKNGKQMEKCENNKWDAIQKKAVGCSYVKFI